MKNNIEYELNFIVLNYNYSNMCIFSFLVKPQKIGRKEEQKYCQFVFHKISRKISKRVGNYYYKEN